MYAEFSFSYFICVFPFFLTVRTLSHFVYVCYCLQSRVTLYIANTPWLFPLTYFLYTNLTCNKKNKY